ncbi:MAG TPA: hypothetical protein VIY48_02480 [Candidatus Paceibacterota bacterium]|jgi:hypothetical protein
MVGTATADVAEIAPAGGIPFVVASRPQRRFSNTQTVSNLSAGGSFAPIQLPATGWVRKVAIWVKVSFTTASAAALVAGDAPFNILPNISITDATGQPITVPISGYNLYLVNKWLPSGSCKYPQFAHDPYAHFDHSYFVSGGTTGTANFRLELQFEQDADTGYGCIPNLDSNASLQLRIDYAAISTIFSGTTPSAASVQITVDQHYWAPVGGELGGVPVRTMPPGAGDYVETRYETQTVTASSENTVSLTNRGGLIKGIIAVSRAAGARTAFTALSNVGLVYDNNAIDEGIKLESFNQDMRDKTGYQGAINTTTLAGLSTGVLDGLDSGVLVWNFDPLNEGGRNTWLSTRVGTLLQLKVTPGASATQLELITQLAQVHDAAAFYRAI